MATPNFVARFSSYSTLARIAKLGACDVWLVERAESVCRSECFILYTLDSGSRSSPMMAEALATSGHRAMQLSHPNIAKTREVLTIQDTVGVIEERISGRTLGDIIAQIRRCKNSIPLWFSIHSARRICDALRYAHAMRDSAGLPDPLYHHAIGPAQVTVTERGSVLVTGFGAGSLDSRSRLAPTVGSSTAIGLASARGSLCPLVDRSVALDVAGTAAVLYELLTLGAFESELLHSHGATEAAPRPFVPPSHYAPWVPRQVDEILRRAMDQTSCDRYSNVNQLCEALDTYLSERSGRVEDEDLAVFMNLLGRSELHSESPGSVGPSANGVRLALVNGAPPQSSTMEDVTVKLGPASLVLPECAFPNDSSRLEDVTVRLSPSMLVPPDRAYPSDPPLPDEVEPPTRRSDDLTQPASRPSQPTLESRLAARAPPKPNQRVSISPNPPHVHDWAAAVAKSQGCAGNVEPAAGTAEQNLDSVRHRAATNDSAAAFFEVGIDCLRSGNLEGAESAWRKVLAVEPEHRAAAVNLRRLQNRRS